MKYFQVLFGSLSVLYGVPMYVRALVQWEGAISLVVYAFCVAMGVTQLVRYFRSDD